MNFSVCRLLLLCALSATVFVSCGKSEAKSQKTLPAREVRVARVELRPMERTIGVVGTLAAQEFSILSAKMPGRLQSVAVDIGSVVKAGEVIAQVEPRDYELRLQQAAAALLQARTSLGLSSENNQDEVNIENVSSVKEARAVRDEATKTYERERKLLDEQLTAQALFDTIEAGYKVAMTRYETALDDARTREAALAQSRAEFDLAKKQLADTAVRAPFDGAVQNKLAKVGEYVATGTPIATLVKVDPLRLQLEVPERESVLVRMGQMVRLTVDGDTNSYSGKIARLSPAINDANRMLLVEADVPSQGSLRAGLFARAQIIVAEGEERLSVPTNALVVFAGIEKVIAVKDGKALEKNVTTGRRGADWVEIISGLSADENVVLNPGGLHTGQPLTVKQNANGAPISRSARGGQNFSRADQEIGVPFRNEGAHEPMRGTLDCGGSETPLWDLETQRGNKFALWFNGTKAVWRSASHRSPKFARVAPQLAAILFGQ